MQKRSQKEKRSYNMSMIRSKSTKPELKLKPILEAIGFEYQPKNIYGRPDFANRKNKVALFIDGCFWHGCPEHYISPKNNMKFWKNKITVNMARDKIVNKKLEADGWRVIRIWEHSIKNIKS